MHYISTEFSVVEFIKPKTYFYINKTPIKGISISFCFNAARLLIHFDGFFLPVTFWSSSYASINYLHKVITVVDESIRIGKPKVMEQLARLHC